jgi:hypothetical protein
MEYGNQLHGEVPSWTYVSRIGCMQSDEHNYGTNINSIYRRTVSIFLNFFLKMCLVQFSNDSS